VDQTDDDAWHSADAETQAHSVLYTSVVHYTHWHMDLNLYCIKGALAMFVLVSFSDYVC